MRPWHTVVEGFLPAAATSDNTRRAYRHDLEIAAAFGEWGVSTVADVRGGHLASYGISIIEEED